LNLLKSFSFNNWQYFEIIRFLKIVFDIPIIIGRRDPPVNILVLHEEKHALTE